MMGRLIRASHPLGRPSALSRTRLLHRPSQGHVMFGSCDVCERRSYGVAPVDEEPHVLRTLPVTATNQVMIKPCATPPPPLVRATFTCGCVSTQQSSMQRTAGVLARGSVRLPLSVIESRVALRWQLAGLILTHEGRGPAPGVTQTCQA